ncbi:MAG: hypothetical protein OXI60_11805 [Acidiferrobacterales bacterium]|nr:hypothetical protein [Acidiferrobacterales bacterium]
MSKSDSTQLTRSSNKDIDDFLRKVELTPRPVPSSRRGRLIFGMDATASREPMWDQACHIQSEMFTETAAQGGLDVQLCYYRGFREFYASKWVSAASELHRLMSSTRCAGGLTQISRLLDQTIRETEKSPVNALVFVGDAMEEDVDRLSDKAGQLGLNGVPAFMFHEGHNPVAEKAFREIATLSGGAYCRFDSSSARQLRDLLAAVAVFAAGGRRALENFSSKRRGVTGQLTHQINRNKT